VQALHLLLFSSITGFVKSEPYVSLHGFNQAQVLYFLTAVNKEGAERSGIIMTALLKSQKDIAAHIMSLYFLYFSYIVFSRNLV
jgi:hypothetical protein